MLRTNTPCILTVLWKECYLKEGGKYSKLTQRFVYSAVQCKTEQQFFLSRDAGISAAYAVVRCLSVLVSVTFVYCVETSKHILKLFPSSAIATPF